MWALLLVSAGCSSKQEPPGQSIDNNATAAGTGSTDMSGAGSSAMPGEPSTTAGSGAGEAGSGSDNPQVTAGSGGGGGEDAPDPTEPVPPPPEVMEQLDPNVDWMALRLIYPRMYSAYDGVHTFQVPVRVDGTTVELSGWSAIPADAVTFDPDPENGGVMITVQKAVPEVTIAAAAGPIGGTAPLYITEATPEDWEIGNARYNNGVDYDLPMLNFADLINPEWVPPEPPDNLACNNCHTTGAKYFEFQHTPTQAARLSNDDIKHIMTTGMKPPGVEFRVLPEAFQHLYVGFHTWEATEEEMLGLIVYLRALTPAGQGDIVLPGGGFGPPP